MTQGHYNNRTGRIPSRCTCDYCDESPTAMCNTCGQLLYIDDMAEDGLCRECQEEES